MGGGAIDCINLLTGDSGMLDASGHAQINGRKSVP